MSRPERRLFAIAIGFAIAAAAPTLHASDALGTPISTEPAVLWPIDVSMEIVQLGPVPSWSEVEADDVSVALAEERATVRDGDEARFGSVVATPRGRLDFRLSVVPHGHPGDAVEIEWELQVEEARYERVGLGSYFLHRLRLGPKPAVGAFELRLSRADIVTVHGVGRREELQIGDQRYELRIRARPRRG